VKWSTSTIGNLRDLHILNLYSNQLSAIPERLSELESLTYLNLNSNNLAVLPVSIGRLKSLRVLNLNNNQLLSLPDTIVQLTALQELSTANNKISALPDSMKRLSSLKELYLLNNQLSSLPDTISEIKSLETIDLRRNLLKKLPWKVDAWIDQAIHPADINPGNDLVLARSLQRGLWTLPLPLEGNAYVTKPKPQGRLIIKIIVAGDVTGKTTMLHRYVSNSFVSDTKMTIGVQFHLKNITFGGVQCTLQLWDFAGLERFRFLLPTYARGAMGALLLFDLTRMQTTFSLESSWLPIINIENQNIPCILVGTHLDMVDPNFPSIEPNFGKDFAISHNLQGYVETSSKTGENIDEGFKLLVKKIFDANNIPYDPAL
jgi:small GTP-binding protein